MKNNTETKTISHALVALQNKIDSGNISINEISNTLNKIRTIIAETKTDLYVEGYSQALQDCKKVMIWNGWHIHNTDGATIYANQFDTGSVLENIDDICVERC